MAGSDQTSVGAVVLIAEYEELLESVVPSPQPADNVKRIMTILTDAAWEGRWSPLDETNIAPLAHITAAVLDAAGCTSPQPLV